MKFTFCRITFRSTDFTKKINAIRGIFFFETIDPVIIYNMGGGVGEGREWQRVHRVYFEFHEASTTL